MINPENLQNTEKNKTIRLHNMCGHHYAQANTNNVDKT
jgi:hypothetical protein